MAKPKRADYQDRLYNVGIRISGKQKNLIIDHALAKGITVSQLIEYAVWQFIRNDEGIAAPGPSQFAKTTREDQVRAYLTGETLLMPCGKQTCNQVSVSFQGAEFCETCNLRIG